MLTLGVSLWAMSAASGVWDAGGVINKEEAGVCKGELVDGAAAGLQLENITMKVNKAGIKSCCNREGDTRYNIVCRLMVSSLSISAN
jgi:hypothetical protein